MKKVSFLGGASSLTVTQNKLVKVLLTSFYLIFVLQDYNEYFRDLNVSNKKKMNGYINQGDCVQLNSIYPDMFRTEC